VVEFFNAAKAIQIKLPGPANIIAIDVPEIVPKPTFDDITIRKDCFGVKSPGLSSE
jgi:hypothetical protein